MIKVYNVRLVQIIKRRRIVTTGPVFSLYTKFTVTLLLACCVLLTCKELLPKGGKPIKCQVIFDGNKDVQGSKELKKAIESYCWVSTTFLVHDAGKFPIRTVNNLPGLTNHRGQEDFETKYYAYYQWVTFALFFQAWFCYLPWKFWKHWEASLMRTIVCGLDIATLTKEDASKRVESLVKYLISHMSLHTSYAAAYWLAEAFCFFGTVAQMALLDWFFDGEFIRYGFNVLGLLQLGEENVDARYDPFIYIFPRVTKCIFHKFGPTKLIEAYDAICVLSLNNTNEKVYIFMWVWFSILALLSACVVLYRILIVCLPSLRQRLLHSRNRLVSAETASLITRTSASDWWIFYMLGRNMDPVYFGQVANEFAKQVTAGRLESKDVKIL